jgi:hypothetical protein
MKTAILPLLLALAPLVASADPRNDNRRWNEPSVTFYQNADFRGPSLTLHPGDTLDNLAGLGFESGGSSNDRISSIRIEGGAEVFVYEDSRYRGRVLRLTESERNLADRLLPESVAANWNDRISSIRVEVRRTGGGPGGFGGPGGGDSRMSRARADDIIRRAFVELLSREPDLSGPNVYRDLLMTQGWTEQMVRDNIRRGEEFRLEGADRIVRQAYLEVLGREPDPSGLASYRNLLLGSNWTGKEVRRSRTTVIMVRPAFGGGPSPHRFEPETRPPSRPDFQVLAPC